MNFDKIANLMDEERNKRAYELFNKAEASLTLTESTLLDEYIRDCDNPQWKPVIDKRTNSDTGYKISNTGVIKDSQGKHLTLYINHKRNGYQFAYGVVIIDDKPCKFTLNVHRLVAENFVPNPENKAEVNHINGNKLCNWYRNLEWNTRQENATHATLNGLIKRGSDQPVAKYTEQDAHNVCKLAEKGLSHKQIAEKLKVSDAFVVGIMYRGEWKHVSKNYKMPKVKSFADKDTIHNICKMLSNGSKQKEVYEKLNVDPTLVATVAQGKAWREISNQYDIPGLEKVEVREKLSNKIYELFDKGVTETDDVIRILGLPDTKGKKKYIAKLRRKYRNREE